MECLVVHQPCHLWIVACALCALALPRGASAQTLDDLWAQYESQTEEFVTLQAECDEGDIQATTTNRLCRSAVSVGFSLAETIEALVERDEELPANDEAALIDGALTTRQIAASILVDLGECEDARERLETLLEDERIAERPNVEDAAQRWLDNANACIAQQVAAQAPEPEPELEPMAAAPIDPPSRTGPIALIATGSALLVGGIAWDLANLSSMSDFEDLNDACASGLPTCDSIRRDDLRDRLDGAKVPIALLYGVGAATAVSGVIWYAVQGASGRDEVSHVGVRPYQAFDGGSTYVGMQLRADW